MKNEEKLLYAIGEVDQRLVPSDKRKRAPLKWAVMGSAAAAAAVAGFVVLRGAALSNADILPNDETGVDIVETDYFTAASEEITGEIFDASIYAEDGLLKIPYNSFSSKVGFVEESMGGICYNNPTFMITVKDCPWSEEQEITSLPVYKNLSYGGDYVYPDCYLNEEKMRAIAEEMAEALGLTIREYDFFNDLYRVANANNGQESPDGGEEEIPGDDYNVPYRQDDCCLEAICDGESYGVEAVKIYVWSRGSVGISTSDLVQSSDPNYMKLPEEYIDDGDELSAYLKERFKDLIGFDNPSEGQFSFYNVTDDPAMNIVNYSLESFDFNINENFDFMGMIIDKYLSVAEKVGDYGIITAEEAKNKLLSAYEDFELTEDGKRIYDTDKRELTDGDIEGVTLFYPHRANGYEDIEYFKPYYCFFVKSVDWSPEWDAYEAYFVPALKDEYIK